MKTFLFAALSLVSGFGKDQEEESLHNLEIEKSSEYMIEGRFQNINNLFTLAVTATGTEDYLYTFDMDADSTKAYKAKTEIPLSDIKDGDTLRITYDGTVSLEYPPKLNNVSKIEIVDDETTTTPEKEDKEKAGNL